MRPSLAHEQLEGLCRFSQRWLWRISSCGMWRRVVCWDATDVSDFFLPWRWRRYVSPKRLLHLNRLHGVTSQKIILFIIGRIIFIFGIH
jgi:hypothetical protein